MRIRAFIAFEIESLALNELLNIRNDLFSVSDNKFEPNDKLHITLKFIGDIEEKDIPKLEVGLKNIANNNSSFNLSFSKFGIFKRQRIPVVLWAGINLNSELQKLYSEIENILIEFGFEKERKYYKPHLTLMRLKKNNIIQKFGPFLEKDLSNIKFNVNEFTLFKSELKKSGSVYSIIRKFNLK
ncbi:MAG: RNA 2',3'-cyclic phosphodiesterase [Bacteroidetes bacterium]|nr:RNA 2',3'-cyclic phosphodiesterase [Bacteroidota bacterium]MBU1113878.1 RNA 2',3'-cyclic phosphodiesterase [Bacteroidota bacterium]MBU1798096.1 RNA 2',3'-cyclic phosphodiesterase [Bacteroidota bacterium]